MVIVALGGFSSTATADTSEHFRLGLFVVIAVTADAVVWERHREDSHGILRRIADRVPIPTTRFGSGYIAEGETIETIAPWGVAGPGD